MQRKRKRRRPKRSRDNVIGQILETRGITWTEAERIACNIKEWYKLIKN